MDSINNRVEGTATDFGGQLKEGFGRVTGDTNTQASGMTDQLKGRAQDALGQAQDALGKVGDRARTAWDGADPAIKQRVGQVSGLAKRNPIITVALVGLAASALSGLLFGGRSNRA